MNVSPSSTTRISRTQQAVTANSSANSAPASRGSAANPMQQPAAAQRLADIHPLDQPQTHVSVTSLENWAKPNGETNDVSSGAQAQRQTIVNALLKKQHNGIVSVPRLKKDVAEVLRRLAAVIDRSIKNSAEGWTTTHIAAENGHTDCLTLLVNAGVDLNKAQNEGATPTFMAAQNGHSDCLTIKVRSCEATICTGCWTSPD